MMLSFQPITLDEMDSIRLMNRIDTKFVTNEDVLADILREAADYGYRACEINGRQLQPYTSLYYDTDGFAMYLAHHNGRKTRQKVRVRTYLTTGESFLEIKHKKNTGRTKKDRTPIDTELFGHFWDDENASEFLSEHSWFKASELKPEVTTEFIRLTLVNPEKTERLTIDRQLHFNNYRSGIKADLGNAVIIELKQDGRKYSKIRSILLENRVHPYRISKYCIGTALTEPGIKRGLFKPKLMYLEKMTDEKLI
jgi:hypothetical protein